MDFKVIKQRWLMALLAFAVLLLGGCNVASPPLQSDSPEALNVVLSGRDAYISWVDSFDNETAYILERAEDRAFSDNNLTIVRLAEDSVSFEDSSLQPGKIYYYRVKSLNRQAESGYSKTVMVLVPTLEELVPAAPYDLSADVVSHSRINLQWKGGGESYVLERALDFTFDDFVKIEIKKGFSSYNDSGLDAESGYYYRVKASNEEGDSAYSRIIRATTEPEPILVPSAPTGFTAQLLAGGQVELEWVDRSNSELGFVIERADNRNFKEASFFFVEPNVTSFLDSATKGGRAYYYRVKALGEQIDSPYSKELLIKQRLLNNKAVALKG